MVVQTLDGATAPCLALSVDQSALSPALRDPTRARPPEQGGGQGRVKILACHNRYAVRGGEDIAFDTAVSLWKGGGHRVQVFERDNQTLEDSSWWLRWRAARRVVFDPGVARDLSQIIRDTRPDVAVVQNTFPLMSLAPYKLLRANGVPLVQVVYNYRYLCLNGELYTQGAICERCAGGNY